MPKYAKYDIVSGEVSACTEVAEGFLEIAEFPQNGGRQIVRGGKMYDCPVIRIEQPVDVVAGEPFTLAVTLPDYPDPPPDDGYKAIINDTQAVWCIGDPITVGVPGDFDFKIIGPFPWSSNIVRFTVVERPEESRDGRPE